jgi:hypothetical protein
MMEAMSFSCVQMSKTTALRRRRAAQTMAQTLGSLKHADDPLPGTGDF